MPRRKRRQRPRLGNRVRIGAGPRRRHRLVDGTIGATFASPFPTRRGTRRPPRRTPPPRLMAFARPATSRIRKQASPLADARPCRIEFCGLDARCDRGSTKHGGTNEVMRRAPEVVAATLARHPASSKCSSIPALSGASPPVHRVVRTAARLARAQLAIRRGQRALRRCREGTLTSTGLNACEIDTVVTVSSTASPLRASKHAWRSNPDYQPKLRACRCSALVRWRRDGLSLAANLARAQPGNGCCASQSTVHVALRHDRIGQSGFDRRRSVRRRRGSGRAAGGGWKRRAGARWRRFEHLWPTRSRSWLVGRSRGTGVILSPELPAFVAKGWRVRPRVFSGHWQNNRPPRFVCHPGGTKVLSAVEHALSIPAGRSKPNARVARLRQHVGPTVLFVLERALAAG